MTELLEISLLGGLALKRGGRPVTALASRKAKALLAYLVCTGRPPTREVLADLFWDERSQSQAMANLRVLLTSLRQALGPYINITRQTVAFNSDSPYWLDVAQLEQGLAAARLQQRQTGGLSHEGATQLAQVLALYQGDFLLGFYLRDSQGFEEWSVTERERLRLRVIEAFHELVAGYLKLGQYPAGIEQTRRLLQLDPLQEEGHRQLMRLLVYSGQRNAALAQYDTCRRILADELGVEPAPETSALYEQIRTGELNRGRGAGERGSGGEPRSVSPAQDWSETPEIGAFYGRQAELAQLEQWLVSDRCRLVAVLGMGGVGKTALTTKLTQALADSFEYVIWRSLLNAPPFYEILRSCLQFLSAQQLTDLPDSLDEQLVLLLDHLRQQRCLIVLDNLEGILQGGDRAGYYRLGYEAYGQLIQRVGEAKHQSCLLLTSRERPRGFARLERNIASVRSLPLAGLDAEAGHQILKARDLSGSVEAEIALIERYSANPLALRLVTETIHEFFEGDIEAFLTEETLVFDDIRDVLDQQFARLPALERDIMIWLAIEREPISTQALWDDLLDPGSKGAFLEALRSLQRRSLLEKSSQGFTLQNVVIEYTTERLITQVYQEIDTERPDLFTRYALLKAQAKEYVRASQARLILQPILERLQTRYGSEGLEARLKALVAKLRQTAEVSETSAVSAPQRGYAGGNLLNLLLHLKPEVSGLDFSGLPVWQAYLQEMRLQGVNFSRADLTGSVFTEVFPFTLAVTFSPDGRLLAAGASDGRVWVWRVADGQLLLTCEGHTSWVWSVCFSPDGQTLASGGWDSTVRLWDVRTGQCLNILPGHTSRVWSVCFSPDGQTLASGSADHTVRLWEVNTGQCLKILEGHTARVWSVSLSPDGETLASGGFDSTIRLWDVRTGHGLKTLEGHTTWIQSLCFSPDGQVLASSSYDRTIRLWAVGAGQPLKTLEEHTDSVNSVCFSPDGQILASGSSDRAIRLWDVETGRCLKILEGHTDQVWSVCFSPDGQTLASGSNDETVRLWELQSGACFKVLRADRPYERMNITGASGLTEAQKAALKALGAVEE